MIEIVIRRGRQQPPDRHHDGDVGSGRPHQEGGPLLDAGELLPRRLLPGGRMI